MSQPIEHDKGQSFNSTQTLHRHYTSPAYEPHTKSDRQKIEAGTQAHKMKDLQVGYSDSSRSR